MRLGDGLTTSLRILAFDTDSIQNIAFGGTIQNSDASWSPMVGFFDSGLNDFKWIHKFAG